ncbi:peptidoglycan endopeptidase [Lachnospiraceae bacterium OF09-6]|nr:peptidoglycan endopeptidase [Lachnospiraceae bacterium OF09-6]
MHKKRFWITSCILAAGFTMNMAGAVGAADAEKGELIFAQCEEYINVRSEADENSEVVAKLYNDGSATVEETEDNGWYKIKSGNAEGYVKAEYFATGEQAKEIADQVAYNVAVVNAEALNIRTTPSEESDVIDVAEQSQELEVVDTSGDWATVALGNDVYGFIHPDYCEYKTYYPTAVTLEEEAAREEAMRRAEEAKAQAAEEASYEEAADSGEEVSEDISYIEESVSTDTSYDDGSASTDTSYDDGSTSTDTSYDNGSASTDTSYDNGSTSTDTSYDDGSASTDTSYDNGSTSTDTSYDNGSTGTDTSYDNGSTGTDTSYDNGSTGTDTSYDNGNTGTDTTIDSSASDSSLGQQIADYAVQFVGNPYVYGGTSLTNGTDCSGFTMSVMANFGIGLARTAADQSYGGTSVAISDIQPGDLLFYSDGSGISHVALYIGGGQIVHAATESQGIIISNYNYDTPVCAARYW